MNKQAIKQLRKNFNKIVFERDNYLCVKCGKPAVDVHHILDRHLLPNGGYVKENGISLCETCHQKAEHEHAFGKAYPGYSSRSLFRKIGSSEKIAYRESLKLEKINN